MTFQIALCLLALVISIVYGSKYKKANAGIMAMALAYIIAMISGIKPSTLIGYWPVKITSVLVSIPMFFGYAAQNGTMELMAKKVLYATRKWSWLPPISIFLASFLVSTCGAGQIAATAFMSPIAFMIAAESGFSLMLVPLAVSLGSLCGGGFIWCAGYATKMSYLNGIIESEEAKQVMARGAGLEASLLCLIIFAISYVIFRGWKSRTYTAEKPEPFNSVQKKQLVLMLIMIAMLMIPGIWKQLSPNAFNKFCSTYFDIQTLSFVFGIICFFLGLGDQKQIILKQIPWNTVMLTGGFTTLMTVAANLGLTDWISGLFTENLSATAIQMLIFAITGTMSFFTGGLAIWAMFLPLIPGLVTGAGCNATALCVCIMTATTLTGMSPFSTGGSLILAGCTSEEQREYVFFRYLALAVYVLVLGVLFAGTPLINLFNVAL